MSMNVDLFFESLNEKIWRNNISEEASRKFDEIIDDLTSHKKEIVREMVKSIDRIEAVKNEQNEEFSYAVFKKWLDKYAKEHITERIEEE